MIYVLSICSISHVLMNMADMLWYSVYCLCSGDLRKVYVHVVVICVLSMCSISHLLVNMADIFW